MSADNPELGLYAAGEEPIVYPRDVGLPPRKFLNNPIPQRPKGMLAARRNKAMVHFLDANVWGNKEWGVDSPDSFLTETKAHFNDSTNQDLRHGDLIAGLDKNGSFVTMHAFRVFGEYEGRPT
tara:strand:- start:15179 stop:15547 length:369 start_codon:yes stop_codon:yes gene_type:complete